MIFVRAAVLGLVLTCVASLSQAAEPITVIWPAPPGGGGDIYFRILGKVITRDFGVPVVVANISGAGGSLGVAKMVSAKPDGMTVAGAWTGPISIAPHTIGVSYKPADYIPVMLFSSAPYVLCTAPDFPANTGSELLDVLKKNPNKYSFGTDGPGGLGQLAATRVFLAFGITQRDIPYRVPANRALHSRAGTWTCTPARFRPSSSSSKAAPPSASWSHRQKGRQRCPR